MDRISSPRRWRPGGPGTTPTPAGGRKRGAGAVHGGGTWIWIAASDGGGAPKKLASAAAARSSRCPGITARGGRGSSTNEAFGVIGAGPPLASLPSAPLSPDAYASVASFPPTPPSLLLPALPLVLGYWAAAFFFPVLVAPGPGVSGAAVVSSCTPEGGRARVAIDSLPPLGAPAPALRDCFRSQRAPTLTCRVTAGAERGPHVSVEETGTHS
jgi:hypothetical protein